MYLGFAGRDPFLSKTIELSFSWIGVSLSESGLNIKIVFTVCGRKSTYTLKSVLGHSTDLLIETLRVHRIHSRQSF